MISGRVNVQVGRSLLSVRTYAHSAHCNGMLDGFNAWLKKIGRKTTMGQASALFGNCQLQASQPFWKSPGKLGEDFRSRHMVLVLHVWMLHKRLLSEGKQGLLVQEALFDELWEDTANRIRGQGIMELSVNKYLKEVQNYSFRCCVELDHILDKHGLLGNNSLLRKPSQLTTTPNQQQQVVTATTDDKNNANDSEEVEIEDEIGGVLWRHVFNRREDIELDHVMSLVKYVRREQASLMTLDRDAVFEGRVAWGPAPLWSYSSTHSDSQSQQQQQQTEHQKDSKNQQQVELEKSSGEWREATAQDGRTYYWNTVTRESRWDKPTNK